MQENQEASTEKVSVSIFKKPSKSKNIRRRTLTEAPGSENPEDSSAVVHRSKVQKKSDGRLEFSSGSAVLSKSKETEDKLHRKTSASFSYESSKLVQTFDDNRATAVLETETEHDRDARAIRERVLKQAEEALQGKHVEDNLYRGINAYTDHKAGFRREHTLAGEKAGGAHGPLRASSHIRMTVRFDYQPDICKDYKETGYCGYGDSCKFLHDRGDYKSGWQLEREWDEKEKKRRDMIALGEWTGEEGGGQEEEDDEEEDELPFACYICRKPFVDPVVTKCKHYFCEHCALKHNAKDKNCFVCNKPTSGIFNVAKEVILKMKERQMAEKKKENQNQNQENDDEDS